MTVPSFWRQPSFSVAETAELVGVSEVTLRTWLTRAPLGNFMGTKTANRIFFEGREIFCYLLVRHLSSYGVPIRTAIHAAALHATDNLPLDKWLVVKTADDVTDFQLTEDIPLTVTPALVIPLRALALDLIERAAAMYAKAGV